MQLLVDLMEVIAVVQVFDLALHLQRPIHNVTVQRQHLLRLKRIRGGLETAQIGEQETAGIADTAIAVAHLLEDILGHGHLAPVIRGADPQAQNIRTQVIPDFLWGNHVAHRLGHLATVLVHGETVSQNGAVWGRITNRQAGQQ